ncbi:GPI anchored protein [Hirsutella rhossiliensis]|uniref:GPI anchored protein n=1 Tax=Hirsutella rhossiliensis TaxID=111463 RepID=A0A9P8N6T7_9HYPO|nr:GPI anchored protein [Hirsutella rhossiliensis]KAH0968042.1 GPI anchored protein [Hirsutella rhossiliensis]
MTQLLSRVLVALAVGITTVPAVGAQMTSGDMGPAAFMWPPDRVWSAAADNTAPCGSVARVGNRTGFPLKNGKIALVAQDESWDAVLSISYRADPKANTDFSTLIDAKAFRDIDPGHTCVPVADAPSSVRAGAKATLQIKYSAEFDKPEVETFYACADITYVEPARFTTAIPCFNATEPSSDQDLDGGSSPSSDVFAGPSEDRTSLSGGAIAGIVVGCVAGVVGLAVAALLVYRRKQQHLHMLRRQRSARGVKWEEQSGRDSNSNPSVKMQNLS